MPNPWSSSPEMETLTTTTSTTNLPLMQSSIRQPSISLKLATDDDVELVMAWRNNSLIFQTGAYTQKVPLTWKEHYNWWNCRGYWWKFFMIIVDDGVLRPRKSGIVNFGQLDNWNPEFNYYLGETSLWGQGVGKIALNIGLNWLKFHGYCKTHSTIRDDNERSINVLKSLGFVRTGEARPGESYWEIKLSERDTATEYTSGRIPFMTNLQSNILWID